MALVITKLANNQVEVTGGSHPYTLLANYEVVQAAEIDGVRIIREGKMRDEFHQSNVTQVVRQDGTIVSISDMSTLYSELKEFFFFEVSTSGGGGGTSVITSYVETITTGDWILDGGGRYYVDAVHNLNTRNLNIEAYNIATNDTEVLDDYERTDVNTVRIWSLVNTNEYDVLISNGGASTLIEAIGTLPEITTDYVLLSTDAGKRHDMNCATTADITVNIGALLDGESAYFTWTGVTQPVFVAGTATIEVDTFGSLKCRGQKATFGIMNRDGIYEVIGKTE